MTELTTTRHNELIDPLLHVWGWEIPVYLFLGGLVAGMMIITGYLSIRGQEEKASCICYQVPLLGMVLLSLGMFALFLDLEHKLFTWRVYTAFEIKSPMSWGSWILLLVYPVLLANMLLHLPEWLSRRLPFLQSWSDKMRTLRGIGPLLGRANLVLGILLGIYTGILLSALGARPLWNSAILGPLFLVSGLSTASALVHMIAREREESEMLARADNLFLGIELVLIALFFIGLLSSSDVQIKAAMLLLTGPFAAAFWVLVILLGIVVPLFLQNLAVTHRIKHSPVVPLLVIAGGLALRFIMVQAGQYSHYLNAHFLK